jgi:hypothetical protein
MVARGFACAANDSSQELKQADFAARQNKVGLWAAEWADKVVRFPSKHCRNVEGHIEHPRRKVPRAAKSE